MLQPEKKGHLKQFAYSSLVSVLFSLIVWLGVSPVIRSTNQNIREKYERNEPKENHRFHGKKLFYLFHEPEEAWYNNLFTLFVGIYTFSRIYILAARKEEVERNYEKLKNESLQSQIDALYNQINLIFLQCVELFACLDSRRTESEITGLSLQPIQCIPIYTSKREERISGVKGRTIFFGNLPLHAIRQI